MRQKTSRSGEPGRRTGCQDSGGVGLAGRAGDRMSERVLERAEAAWEEQRGQRILIEGAQQKAGRSGKGTFRRGSLMQRLCMACGT